MSFTAKTAFEARITNNSNDTLCNVAGKFRVSSTDTDCSAGMLCVRNGKIPVEGISGTYNGTTVTVYNENTWYMNAATSSADANDVIYACNTYDNQLVPGVGNNQYFIGRATLGLGVPAGRYGNFTRINFDNESVYRFGEGNVTINTTGDTYFTIDNGMLTSVTAKPSTAGVIYFELRATGKFVEGTNESFGYYDLVACKVAA